jgi:hypothetical protein
MPTVTKAANAHTVVATGWTNPSNCYSTTNDSSYATLVCPKNGTNSGDFGFPAFTTSDIPDGSTINSVTFYTTYGVTVATTGALVGMQARRNSTGTTLGSEITRSLASMADANGTATGCTLTDLRTANELRVRARATKGNSNTASTAQIDRLYVTVDYTLPPENHDGGFAGTGGGVAAEAGRKGGQWSGVLTGGGVIVETQTGAHNEPFTAAGGGVLSPAMSGAHGGSLAATGGGVIAEVGAGGRQSGVTATGGGVSAVATLAGRQVVLSATGAGVLTWGYERSVDVENHDGAFVLTGGGIAAITHTAAHVVALSLTGAGVLAPVATTDRRIGVAVTGAGVAAQGQATARTGYSAATGGGLVALGASTGRGTGVTATGGGVAALSWTGAHWEPFAATGGGAAALVGTAETPPEDHPGHLAATGGGAVTFADRTDRGLAAHLTGGGIVALAQTSSRAVGWHASGGGLLAVSVGGDHIGGLTGTGSGEISVVALGPVQVIGLAAHMSLATIPPRICISAVSGVPIISSARRVE